MLAATTDIEHRLDQADELRSDIVARQSRMEKVASRMGLLDKLSIQVQQLAIGQVSTAQVQTMINRAMSQATAAPGPTVAGHTETICHRRIAAPPVPPSSNTTQWEQVQRAQQRAVDRLTNTPPGRSRSLSPAVMMHIHEVWASTKATGAGQRAHSVDPWGRAGQGC